MGKREASSDEERPLDKGKKRATGSSNQQVQSAKKSRLSPSEDEDAADRAVQISAEGDSYINLGNLRRVTVRQFKGRTLIDFREFYNDKASGKELPGKKGISLSAEQWDVLKANISVLDDLIKQV